VRPCVVLVLVLVVAVAFLCERNVAVTLLPDTHKPCSQLELSPSDKSRLDAVMPCVSDSAYLCYASLHTNEVLATCAVSARGSESNYSVGYAGMSAVVPVFSLQETAIDTLVRAVNASRTHTSYIIHSTMSQLTAFVESDASVNCWRGASCFIYISHTHGTGVADVVYTHSMYAPGQMVLFVMFVCALLVVARAVTLAEFLIQVATLGVAILIYVLI